MISISAELRVLNLSLLLHHTRSLMPGTHMHTSCDTANGSSVFFEWKGLVDRGEGLFLAEYISVWLHFARACKETNMSSSLKMEDRIEGAGASIVSHAAELGTQGMDAVGKTDEEAELSRTLYSVCKEKPGL
ncbi:hypothetical protein Mapa_012386 [Marchantia paleacea]|nr:hypothetical protein Mapa_012386 [Marchantia paleacea]